MKKVFSKFSLLQLMPILQWLPQYKGNWIKWDLIAGVTLASFVLPESMAYATLAGLPPHYGIYCVLVAGIFFAIFTSSKHVAVGPTSSISLMVGTTVAVLSAGDPQKWIAIAGLSALVVAVFCIIAYLLKLSSLVNFISDSILLGFKAGAALSIMATQLPKIFGLEGGGSNFFLRLAHLIPQLPEMLWPVFLFGIAALVVIIAGDHFLPGKPVSLFVVVVSILLMTFSGLSSMGFHLTGEIPSGLPALGRPSIKLSDVDGVIELAFACFLMGYIETVSAARTMAMKNNYTIDPRQELLSLGAANLSTAFFSGYIVAGGLSQSTVNEKSGAKTPLSLIICAFSLAVILLFFTNLLTNLPEVILAVIVIHAVTGLIKIKELRKIFHLSKMEFSIAIIALVGVLVFGILKGVMISVILSLIFLIRKASYPNVAVLGRIGETHSFSDISRHPDNIQVSGLLILRIESSIMYFNSDDIFQKITAIVNQKQQGLKQVVIELSASPYVDVSGSKMLLQIADFLKQKDIQLKLVDVLSEVREILRKQGLENHVGHISRELNLFEAVEAYKKESGMS
jgi:high affinity sulfate transporter 1